MTGARAGRLPVPRAGDRLPGWRLELAEDFDRPFAAGAWPGPYRDAFLSYDNHTPDTSQVGCYHDLVLSAHDSVLDWHVGTYLETGRPTGCVVVPCLAGDGTWPGTGRTYGRYAVQWRADAVAGYGVAWMLWDVCDVWANGEIDFPEGALDGAVQGFVHRPGEPQVNELAVDTGVAFAGGWHVAVIEWTPAGVLFLLDGAVVGRTAVSPSAPMRWTLQVGTNGVPTRGAEGHILLDWVAVWSPERS